SDRQVTRGGTMSVKRILVGMDGSEHAGRAARWAADLAAATGAEVVAVHAVGLLVTTPDGPVPSTPFHDRLREQLAGEWTAELRKSGVPVRCRLVEGSAVTALLQSAEEEGADLLVMGSRGAGGFSELHLGSTSHQVALYADRPVTIVPPPGRVRPGTATAGSPPNR
ncbi:MAG TPA: universal stress protein, partial [Acidimicrobiia bacterium]|nr:universal stress protein [Acidimicrobiia bacterium]